MTLHTA